ncbi:MAG TPA: hypothetical protein VLD67_03585 [Vicinamibacterales bacterium]|nr:hypothetical protein [Vicinamibacterales bacterium]
MVQTDTSAIRAHRPAHPVAAATLERFAAATAAAEGLHISDLSPIDQLHVRTRNTTYRITVISPRDSRILVQGGAFFPIPCEAHLCGGSLGGSLLKLGWIGCGFSLEILHEGRRIVTTRVRSIEKHEPARDGNGREVN